MQASTLFYILIGILVVDFLWNAYLEYLNAKHYDDPVPVQFRDLYDADAYRKSQDYKKENYRLSKWSSLFNTGVILLFFFLKGFAYLDAWVRSFTDKPIIISMLFIGILVFLSDIINIPFSYYHTFVIEEKYGFNKTTQKTFWMDKLKAWLLMLIIGGALLFAVIGFYEKTGKYFWLYTWTLVSVFAVFMNMFYASLIVPLFNKQMPLEEGALKDALEALAHKLGFRLDNIYVIDGSKRSTKANAYFTGLGPKKRIVLYDTLISDLEVEEIVGVLTHEIGHYKHKHTYYNLILSILTTGVTLYILSLFIDAPILSQALGVSAPSFHIGVIAFSILYSPISSITGFWVNKLSRKFEYQADAFAKMHYKAAYLISALKKLAKNSFSNLTPHPLYVAVHYSHPTLLQRILRLSDESNR